MMENTFRIKDKVMENSKWEMGMYMKVNGLTK